ncbi:MAG: AAA family ATPase, partial [Candidatus Riflebacteria bacterium]|nr:AAA family ATPase [Candidatus Riflebacteria bacterium]
GLSRYKKELSDNTAELSNLEKQDKDLKEALESQKDAENAILARLNALNEMISNKKIELAQVSERKKAIQKEIDAANRRRRDNEGRKKRATDEATELDQQSQESQQSVTALQAEIDDLSKKRDIITQAIEAVQEEYARMSRELEVLDRTYQSRVKIIESTRKKLSELDVKLAEINTHISTKEGILSGDYAYNQDPALFNPKKYESREDLAGSINSKHFEQMALGAVNPLAIEDYEKAKERFDFLNSQLSDLKEAATSLEDLIDEIEKTSSEKFLEAFNLVNTAFEHIFEILFPGGSGTLKLSNKEDVLTSNVDVVCKLPGKKLTTLELFSGGEKSMISLALLFSILEVKPPAFCLLDEVEAALDEANVKRFNRMLRNFADKTQFLVITHNKETMQTVDVIYGVTMQKGGISKPISIRLEDNEKIKEFSFDGKGSPKERNIKLTEKAA